MNLTKNLILEELNNKNLKYGEYETSLIVDYLLNLYDLNLLPGSVTYKDLIAKLEKYNVSIVFFNENHEVNQKWGNDFKGNTHTDDKGNVTIYIRDSLVDKELYFYHELTHLFQTRENKMNVEFDYSGLTDDSGYGHMFNEVATQTLAEKIYNNKYNLSSEFLLYDSSNLRMLSGYEIWSDLKNYQMYDYITSLLLECIDLTKEDLIKEAFNNECKFMNILEEKSKKISWIKFEDLKYILEYIFCTDNVFYTNPEQRVKLENGESVEWQHLDYYFVNQASLNRNIQLSFYQTICDNLKMQIEQNEKMKNVKH